MAKVFIVLLLVLLAIPAFVVADPPDAGCYAANTAGGVCLNGTGMITGPGMMRAGTGSGACVNGGAGGCADDCRMMACNGTTCTGQTSCGMISGAWGPGNSSCGSGGVTGGERGPGGYGYGMGGGVPGGMMGGYGTGAMGSGMQGWVYGGAFLFLILAIVWIIVGILLSLLLFKKISAKEP